MHMVLVNMMQAHNFDFVHSLYNFKNCPDFLF